jgi:hypothetical protein
VHSLDVIHYYIKCTEINILTSKINITNSEKVTGKDVECRE